MNLKDAYPTLSDQDAEDLAGPLSYKGAFIGGSFLVDPEVANDIDVVVPEYSFDPTALLGHGFHQTSQAWYQGCPELLSTWRCRNVNVLVIRDAYVVAYQAATNVMRFRKDEFRSREARVKIHQRFKDQITSMLAEACPLEVLF
jgi:hypothetical protein